MSSEPQMGMRLDETVLLDTIDDSIAVAISKDKVRRINPAIHLISISTSIGLSR